MSEAISLVVPIRAELATAADDAAVRERLMPGLQALLASLDIPVRLEYERVEGMGRIQIGKARPRFAAIPTVGDGTLRLEAIPWYAEQFITTEMTTHLWRAWYPERASESEQPRPIAIFSRMLREAVSLGFRLGRFRDAFGALTAADPDGRWDDAFEAVLSANDCPRIRLLLSRHQYKTLVGPEWRNGRWGELARFMNDGLFVELGIQFPMMAVSVDDDLSAPFYRWEWNDVRLPPRRGLHENELLANDTVERLRLTHPDVVFRESENPATLQPGAIGPAALKEALEAMGLTTWDAAGYLILDIAAQLRMHADSFVTVLWLEFVLFNQEKISPELTRATRERFNMTTLARILRGLAAEQVPMRHMAGVLNALLTVRATLAADPRRVMAIPLPGSGTHITARGTAVADLAIADYVEVARRAMKRELAHKYARGTSTLVAYLFDLATEERLAASPSLSAADREALHKGLSEEMSHLPPTAQVPVLLVSSDVRHRLLEELSPEFHRRVVLSLDELPPELNIQPVARISPQFG